MMAISTKAVQSCGISIAALVNSAMVIYRPEVVLEIISFVFRVDRQAY